MTKREQITEIIENYLLGQKKFANEISLVSKKIRTWENVAHLCENEDMPNICNAMKSVVKFTHKYIDGVEGSTTYKIRYYLEQ